jgi:hypothetical protein
MRFYKIGIEGHFASDRIDQRFFGALRSSGLVTATKRQNSLVCKNKQVSEFVGSGLF